MMYPFMTLTDGTGIAHSDAYDSNGVETVKVYIEQPIYGGFRSAECYLPTYECFILGKHTARNGVAGISPPRREFQKC